MLIRHWNVLMSKKKSKLKSNSNTSIFTVLPCLIDSLKRVPVWEHSREILLLLLRPIESFLDEFSSHIRVIFDRGQSIYLFLLEYRSKLYLEKKMFRSKISKINRMKKKIKPLIWSNSLSFFVFSSSRFWFSILWTRRKALSNSSLSLINSSRSFLK